MLSEVMKALEVFAPLGLSEPWDHPGLQVGDPGGEVATVLVALDASSKALEKATEIGAQLLLTHHPLLFSPLTCLDLSRPAERLVSEFLRRGIAVYSSHTNLDRADGGVNDALARALGLSDLVPLADGEEQVKLVVTVPVGYESGVRQALAEAGAGRVGSYEECSFYGRGTGTFRPRSGAEPFIGRVGGFEKVEESRLEVVVPRSRVEDAMKGLSKAHPYELPSVDLYPLVGRSQRGALGRVGVLPGAMRLSEFAGAVARALHVPDVRLAGNPETRVERVAVCGGSGSDLWRVAGAKGAQVLVTGDVKYHVAREVMEAGFAMIDAGHCATEAVAVRILEQIVSTWAAQAGLDVRVEVFVEPEPMVTMNALSH